MKLLFVFSLFVFACQTEKKPSPEMNSISQREGLDSMNKIEGNKLAAKYNAIAGWDTLELYTYQIQDTIISRNGVTGFEGTIEDIVKDDSGYTLKVKLSAFSISTEMIADIHVSLEQFKPFRQHHSKYFVNGFFICKVNKAVVSFPVLSAGKNNDDEDNWDLTYKLRLSVMKLKTTLIDFYVYK